MFKRLKSVGLALTRIYEGAVAHIPGMKLVDQSMDVVGNAFNAAAKAIKTESGYLLDDLNLRGGAIEKMIDTILPHVDEFTDSLQAAGASKPTTEIKSNAPAQRGVYEYALRIPGGIHAAQNLLQRDGIEALDGISIAQVPYTDHYVITVRRSALGINQVAVGEACYHTAKHVIDWLDRVGAQRVKHEPQAMAQPLQTVPAEKQGSKVVPWQHRTTPVANNVGGEAVSPERFRELGFG